jgi:hypothetical protein
MEQKWYFRGERVLGAFKYIIAIFMMVAGVLTPLQDLTPVDGPLGFIYSSRLALSAFGLAFFLSGASLFYGKIAKSKKWTGNGLFAIFTCFLFSGLLETTARHVPSIGNFTSAFIVGALYLRWRFKTVYIDPNHFVDDVDTMRKPRV